MALSHGPSAAVTSEAPRSGARSALAAKALSGLIAIQSMVAGCTTVGTPGPRPGMSADGGSNDGQGQDGQQDGSSRRGQDVQLLDLGSFPTFDAQEPVDLGTPRQPVDTGTVDTGMDTGADTGAETDTGAGTPDAIAADTVSKYLNCMATVNGKDCQASLNPKTKIKIPGKWKCETDGTPNCVPN